MFYSYYMQNLTGAYDTDSYEFLQQENKKFEPIQQAQYMRDKGLFTNEEYQMLMNKNYILQQEYTVFQNVIRKLQYIGKNPSAHLVYETGYKKLFGLDALNANLKYGLFASISIVVLLAGLFSIEKTSGVKKVIFATPLGRKDTVLAKLKVSATRWRRSLRYLSILPRIWQVGRYYGFKGLFSPAMSMFRR